MPLDAGEHRKRGNKTQTLQWRLISFDMLIVGGLEALMHTIFRANKKARDDERMVQTREGEKGKQYKEEGVKMGWRNRGKRREGMI